MQHIIVLHRIGGKTDRIYWDSLPSYWHSPEDKTVGIGYGRDAFVNHDGHCLFKRMKVDITGRLWWKKTIGHYFNVK